MRVVHVLSSLNCLILVKIIVVVIVVTQSICRKISQRGFTVLAYLDDFLIIEPSQQQCQIAVDTHISLLQSVGFTINWSKVVQPSQSLCFLGVEIDTVNRVLWLPRDRVSDLLDILNLSLTKRKCQKHHLQRLVGKLSWATQVVRGGPDLFTTLDNCNELCKTSSPSRLPQYPSKSRPSVVGIPSSCFQLQIPFPGRASHDIRTSLYRCLPCRW